jgi:hypothetical protein
MVSPISTNVIIPRFSKQADVKYFIPRFAKIQRGESVQWTNLDSIPHRLVFYKGRRRIGTLGPISPGTALPTQFSYEIVDRIDYYCDIPSHGKEMGIVIIFSQDEETMNNTERLRYLSRVFNINPPDVLAHLRG